jgi:hypothetical protein
MIWRSNAVQHIVCERYGAVMQISILFFMIWLSNAVQLNVFECYGAVMQYSILFVNDMAQ